MYEVIRLGLRYFRMRSYDDLQVAIVVFVPVMMSFNVFSMIRFNAGWSGLVSKNLVVTSLVRYVLSCILVLCVCHETLHFEFATCWERRTWSVDRGYLPRFAKFGAVEVWIPLKRVPCTIYPVRASIAKKCGRWRNSSTQLHIGHRRPCGCWCLG